MTYTPAIDALCHIADAALHWVAVVEQHPMGDALVALVMCGWVLANLAALLLITHVVYGVEGIGE